MASSTGQWRGNTNTSRSCIETFTSTKWCLIGCPWQGLQTDPCVQINLSFSQMHTQIHVIFLNVISLANFNILFFLHFQYWSFSQRFAKDRQQLRAMSEEMPSLQGTERTRRTSSKMVLNTPNQILFIGGAFFQQPVQVSRILSSKDYMERKKMQF